MNCRKVSNFSLRSTHQNLIHMVYARSYYVNTEDDKPSGRPKKAFKDETSKDYTE